MDVSDLARITLLLLQRRRRRRKQRNMWIHPINSRRAQFGTFAHLFPDLLNNPDKFHDFFRIDKEKFKQLVELLRLSIQKQNTNYRRAIEAEERLAIYLR